MILIKKLIEPIRSCLGYDDIIEFSKIWASTEKYHKINDEILQKYIKRELEKQNHQEVCRMKLDNIIELEKIDKEVENIEREDIKSLTKESMEKMKKGQRDFYL